MRLSSLKSLRLVLAQMGLALLLLLSQQHAAVHWLSHAVEATHGKPKGTLNEHCADCGALSALDGAAPVATLAALAVADVSASSVSNRHVDAQPAATWPVFHSRAPPRLL